MNKKIISVVVVLVIVTAVLVVVSKTRHPQGPSTNNPPQATTTISTIKYMPSGQLPPALPQDIVLATDAKITGSYTAITKSGKPQSTLIYLTKQSENNMVVNYMVYFAKNSWTVDMSKSAIAAGSNSSLVKQSLVATHAGNTLTLGFFPVASSTQSMVSINLIAP